MTSTGIAPKQHVVSVVIGSQQVKDWESYQIEASMLTPADRFTMRLPFDADAWNLCVPDTEIRIKIDDVTVMRGFIDRRTRPEDDEVVEIWGRDRVGRLVDESAPGLSYQGLDMFTLIGQVAAPWFTQITFSNARNRKVQRGRGKKAKAGGEPVILKTQKKIGSRVEPGQTRWKVIEDLCAQAGYLAWSAGDGIELVVGEPNYDQEPQWRFFKPAKNSIRTAESTVLAMGVHDDVSERYSRIIVVGSGQGDDANYGASVASRFGQAKNNPATLDGDGLDFTAPKRLVVQRAVQSIDEANEIAAREMAQRDAKGERISVRATGHGQVIAGAFPTIFTTDTIASCEDEATDRVGFYLITACTYRGSRDAGEETSLELVPTGARLVA